MSEQNPIFPPEAMIMQLATGGFVAQAVHTAASLDIADLLAEGPRTISPGGMERTAEQFDALLASAGFKVKQIIPTMSPVGVVEAVKA